MGKGKRAFTFYSVYIDSVFLMRMACITCMIFKDKKSFLKESLQRFEGQVKLCYKDLNMPQFLILHLFRLLLINDCIYH